MSIAAFDLLPRADVSPRIPRTRQRALDLLARAAELLERDASSTEGLRALHEAALERRCFEFAGRISQRLLEVGGAAGDGPLQLTAAWLHLGQLEAAAAALAAAAKEDVPGIDALRGLHALMTGDAAAALDAFAAAGRTPGDTARVRRLAWAETWLRALVGRAPVISTPKLPLLVLLDHKSPDFLRASTRVDDYLASLAVLRLLASATTFHSAPAGLDAVIARLRQRWPLREIAHRPPAELAILDRDSLWAADLLYPGRTLWAVLGGRLFARAFGLVAVAPASPTFHAIVVDLDLPAGDIDAGAIAWLRRFQPIGCRDQATAQTLLNQGVEAFISGSLLSTLGVLTRGGLPSDSEDVALRTDPLGAALIRALDAWESAPILDEAPDDAVPLAAWLQEVVALAASGASASIVNERWRNLTQAAVQRAQGELAGHAVYQRRPAAPPARRTRHRAPAAAVTLAFSLDRAYLRHVPTVLQSIRAHSRADLDLVFLTRGLDDGEVTAAAAIAQPGAVREIAMDRLPPDGGVPRGSGKGALVLDRLFLPRLLPGLDRLVYLDLDLIVRGDVAELASFEPSARGIAARPTPNVAWATVARAFALRAQDPAQLRHGRDVRGLAAAASDLSAPYFNAGVLVLSLARMRQRQFVAKALRAVREFHLNDQDVLNLYAGGDFTPLPWEWNANPYFEFVDAAQIIHWAGDNKPWEERPVLAKRFWRQA